jgi:cell division protein FtsN
MPFAILSTSSINRTNMGRFGRSFALAVLWVAIIAVGAGRVVAQAQSSTPSVEELERQLEQNKAANAKSSAADAWNLQLGSFATKYSAAVLVQKLSDLGYSPQMTTVGSGTQVRYRVRLGPFSDGNAAGAAATKLKSQGYAASVVAP